MPDRPISRHPNLIIEAGSRALELQLRQARRALEAAKAIEDVNERRRQAAGPLRDVRYLAARVRTAQVCPESKSIGIVAFGSTVTLILQDGRAQAFKIVGEDEADPKAGSMSFVSPVAKLVVGKTAGKTAGATGHEIEIISVS